MELGKNSFKQALVAGRSQIGLWSSLPGGYAAELIAGSGFDWIMFDTEHSPADPITTLGQLQAVAPHPVSPIVRPAANDPVLIKRFLDIGAQTLLIPMVQNAAEAEAAVKAIRYPPAGIRGVAGTTRATQFGRISNYIDDVENGLCLLIQVETLEAVDNLAEIAAVDGVDGIFIGPADLAASMGHAGKPMHPDVRALVSETILQIKAANKPAGILAPDISFAQRCIDLGTTFTAVGMDANLLAAASDRLRERFIISKS